MKIYLMTDLEGVAGVVNFEDWCTPESRYYETGKEFLTLEVNAAVDGFFAGGATQVTVADGHGHGAISPKLLDSRADLLRGWPEGWPLLLDRSYDAVAWVGQHAKAGTEYSHLTHTQGWGYIDLSVNGVSIGEFGQLAVCASELGVRVIFASGEEAFTKEVQALTPGVETVSVKRGTTPGKGDELDAQRYSRFHLSAIHVSPERSRQMIRAGAERAVRRAQQASFGLIDLKPPFERVARFRQDGDRPRTVSRESHPSSVIALMNMPFNRQPE
jgi:D-amino peptidase